MPISSELIRDFTNKNHVDINGDLIQNIIERILISNNNNRSREANIEKYIVSTYSKIAEEFERTRAESMLNSPDTASKTSSYEFFAGYVNIVSEIAKETSARLVSQVDVEKENLIKAVDDAKRVYEDAKKELDTGVNNYKARHNGSTEGIDIIDDYKKLKDNAEIAKIKLKNAEEKQAQGVNAIPPFEQSEPYFGMSANTAKALLEKQVKSCNYMELRREQIERSGIRTNNYVLEIEKANIPDNVTYKAATVEQKRKLQEIHATKQIMQEKLDSRTTGSFAWFKKWWYRKDIAALNSYMNAANQTLNRAKFDEQDAADAIDAMTKRGFFHDEYKASGAETFLNEQLAENTMLKERLKEKYVNKDKYIDAAAKKDAVSQMFEVRFRPTAIKKDLIEQINIGNQISKEFVQGNTSLDQKAKSVFNMNMKKLRAMKEHFEKYADPRRRRSNEEIQNNYNQVIENFDRVEREFILQNPDYVPVTIENIQTSMTKRESLADIVSEDIKDNLANTEVSQPVVKDPSVAKKDQIINS